MIYTQESQTFDAERKGHLGSTGPEGVFPLVSPCLAGCGWELQGKGRACQGRAGYAGQVWGLTFHCSSGGRWRERGRLSCILRLRTEQMCFQGEEIRLLFPRKYLGREIRAQPFKLNSLPTSLEPKKNSLKGTGSQWAIETLHTKPKSAVSPRWSASGMLTSWA